MAHNRVGETTMNDEQYQKILQEIRDLKALLIMIVVMLVIISGSVGGVAGLIARSN